MQFIVMAYDYKDKNALTRRLAARDQHLKFAKEMFDKKRWVVSAAAAAVLAGGNVYGGDVNDGDSYNASDIGPKKFNIDEKYVEDHLEELIKSQDLSKFIL